MARFQILYMLLITAVRGGAQGSSVTITPPDTIKTESGMTASVVWTLSETFDVNSGRYEVFRGLVGQNEQILSYVGTASDKCNLIVPSVSCISHGNQLGFNITNVQPNNASIYSINVELTDFGPSECNEEAVLYLYESPGTPNITGHIGQAGWIYNLSCYAKIQSLPEEFQNQSTIQYTWSGDYSGSGSSISIGLLQKEDNGKSITCTAIDQGASDSLSVKSNVSIIVYYAPEDVLLTTNTNFPVENVNDIQLSCRVADNQHGNPTTYSYYWLYPNGVQWTNSTEDSLIIDKTNVNATLHDGQWKCKIGNFVGNTTADLADITVNAVPSVLQHPTNTTILVNEPLAVACSFTAKPAANITWIRGSSDVPNMSVINITHNNTDNGPYTITTSMMSWRTDDINERRLVTDMYRCKSVNSAGMQTSQMMNLNIQYWPWTISFIGPGDTSNKAEIIENTELVNRTCDADCNPACSYVWINDTSGNVVSDTEFLDLRKPSRYEAGNYTCNATNMYGTKTKLFSLQVKFSPSISVTTSNNTDVIERDNITMMCDVSSYPVSEIKLYNKTNNQTLDTVTSDNKALYQFTSINCLHTGEYMFTASNGIPNELYQETAGVYMDVMCAPSKVNQIPNSGVEGVPLGENYTLEIEILSNPQPTITARSWSFIDYNGTQYDVLPENVHTYIESGTQRLTVKAKLHITEIDKINYGKYTLYTGNKYGNMTPVILAVSPKGPPSTPSAPRLMDITAVSIKLNWTAGFNGGLQQTFTVLYRIEGSDKEHEENVVTDPDVNKGDIIVHKLGNKETIRPNTTYWVRIKAENSFEGSSVVNGNPALFTTSEKATFIADPEITILDDTAKIHFMISGPLTHIIEENCVTDTNRCAKYNISVPNNKNMMMLRETVTHDFSVEVPLADIEATQFVFYFWMYDGEDLLYSEADSIPVDISGVSTGVIIGIVTAIVLAAAIVTTFVILWKRGIFPKKDSKNERYTREDTDPGQYVNPSFSDQENERQLEVGPINGDTYALVAKSGNQNTAKKPTPPKKPSGLKPEPVYVNKGVPESMAGRQTRDQGQRSDLPFSLVGVDGTVYADLQVIGQPSETGQIHGIENKVEYIDIGIIKTMNS